MQARNAGPVAIPLGIVLIALCTYLLALLDRRARREVFGLFSSF